MKNFILKKFSLKNFTLKKFKRYVPASATVEAAFVIPLVIYAVATVTVSYTHLTLPTTERV